MITHGEDVEIHALRKQGWSISAIARHMGLDRKTVRAYLALRVSGRSEGLEQCPVRFGGRPVEWWVLGLSLGVSGRV